MDWVESQINDEAVRVTFIVLLLSQSKFCAAVSRHYRHSLPQELPAAVQEDSDAAVPRVCPRVRAPLRQDHEHRGRAPRQHLLQAFLLLRHRVRAHQ